MSRGMKRVCRVGAVACLLIVAVPWSGRDGAWAQSDLDARAGKQLDSLVAIYKQLHANPELSTQEEQTSALIAKELRATGFEVTDHFGQYALPETKAYGVVALLRNGPGPTVMVRTDMDALPIVENTGVPYASKVRVKVGGRDRSGSDACLRARRAHGRFCWSGASAGTNEGPVGAGRW